MATLEQAARAWIDLGRVMYPSLAEVEASLTGRSHVSAAPIHGTPRTAEQIADDEEETPHGPPDP